MADRDDRRSTNYGGTQMVSKIDPRSIYPQWTDESDA